ncbi:uncharacterized protein LOC110924930 [Helianthus annuus]|uniref:uncharacterized protein LOC110924930 n=1 Tax=Helianthus annuus TaxID=4232 RepID=UPI000B906B9B|nr:uncharacterized protein LOC110924930 [Helianthus annuus]
MHKFSNTRLDAFPSVSAYCQELKVLADQLANINAPVDNERLVLQLIAGLNESYEGIATILQQQEPLPSFYTARSKLIQVETRKAEQALVASKTVTALNTTTSRAPPNTESPQQPYRSDYSRGRGMSRGHGRGRGSSDRSRYPHPNSYWQPPPYAPWMNSWSGYPPPQSPQYSPWTPPP